MQRANALVGEWMRDAKLEVREDAAFNLIGRWSSIAPKAKTLVLGSHLDTVRNAGKYDGPLGVLTALAAVGLLRARNVAMPFHIEVVGFSDEEGVRYQTTYLGSRAMAGTLTDKDLAIVEEKGIDRAKRDAGEFLAYAEVHIEQGPVLETKKKALGIVTSIAGQSRLSVEFEGMAGHAGTTPMRLRRDALAGAAEFIGAVEKSKITATVGQLQVAPGASNVIPGHVKLSLDVRDQNNTKRRVEVKRLHKKAQAIAKRRKLKLYWKPVQETATVPCDPAFTKLLRAAAARHESNPPLLASGAGHDAAAMSVLCPVTMLFVRCRAGLSHHPDESIKLTDASKAIGAVIDFILKCKDLYV
ncbi:MAG: Zn-dependent hydrolase [Chthoniobacteraceae bacterium]